MTTITITMAAPVMKTPGNLKYCHRYHSRSRIRLRRRVILAFVGLIIMLGIIMKKANNSNVLNRSATRFSSNNYYNYYCHAFSLSSSSTTSTRHTPTYPISQIHSKQQQQQQQLLLPQNQQNKWRSSISTRCFSSTYLSSATVTATAAEEVLIVNSLESSATTATTITTNSTNTKSKSDIVWDNMYGLLVTYKKREGHCNVPRGYKKDEENNGGVGETLGRWLLTQRQNKKKDELDAEKVYRLNELGIIWNIPSQQWEDMYTLLIKYKQREGHCNVPVRYKVAVAGGGEKNLGKWLTRQRYVKKKGQLDPFKEERLMDVGIVWDLLSQQWENMFTVLVQYKQREGNCNVPSRYITEDYDGGKQENLGRWLGQQRRRQKLGKLDTTLQHRLDDLGVVWDTNRFSVMQCIQQQQQKENEGGSNSVDDNVDNVIHTKRDRSSKTDIQEYQSNKDDDTILHRNSTALDYNTNSRWVDDNMNVNVDVDVNGKVNVNLNLNIDKDSNNNVGSRKVDDDGQEKNSNTKYDDDDEKKIINKLKSESNLFEITSPYGPMGDQPKAISKLVKQINRDDKYSVLRGCTGTGKTFVMSQVIAQTNKPALILCHNKSLAAQLARELQSHLRNNHIRLFVSYYNHYKPEYYDPIHNKYGSKKSSVNDELDALRHLATESLLQHKDVVIVASVSCIYGLGMPQAYMDASVRYTVGDTIIVGKQNGMRNNGLDTIQTKLESLLYVTPERSIGGDPTMTSDAEDLGRGCYYWSYHSRGTISSLMIWPPSERYPVRIDFETQQKHPPSSTSQSSSSSLTASQSTMYTISSIYHGNSKGMVPMESTTIFPAKHHISGTKEEFEESLKRIEDEVAERYKDLCIASKKEEADRISERVAQDLALLRETGTCPGIENYSRHMALKDANVPPSTLLDYFGLINGDDDNDDDDEGSSDEIKINDDWLLVVDESHVTIPQLKAMYGGDRARKEKLVEHGYRLPSALDNRPLRSEEFWERIPQTLFVSATPSQRELDLISNIPDNEPVDMMIRPTFVCDPHIEVRPIENQLEDLVKEISDRSKRNERTLAMTVTKRDAEDLATYLIATGGVNAMYIHSGLNTHERSKALQALQSGEIDCLVGVNLLREGLDLPQVSLVAILNADFEGFLRSETALLQTIGRAARNINGKAIFYASKITRSMKKCMDATESRREAQLDYNLKNNKEMKSTQGSSTQSIFDLLKDQIDAGKQRRQASTTAKVGIDAITLPLEGGSAAVSSLYPAVQSLQGSKGNTIVTDHLPSKPGVYFWKEEDENILYIGKAEKLRSRVKSYLNPGAKHSPRIRTMVQKSHSVEFILTPSDRDALILEDKLIKHHQPLYNVLLKDDESYPYICATVGDEFPSFTIVPRKLDGGQTSEYRYFGPYPHYSEINKMLDGIEEKYSLRSIAFQARHGTMKKMEYQKIFLQALDEIFDPNTGTTTTASSSNISTEDKADDLAHMRTRYEEASMLFDSDSNKSRDVVAVGKSDDGSTTVIYVLQLRDGMVTGQFSYNCEVASELQTEEELADAMQRILQYHHYPSGATPMHNNRSFFPTDILVQYPIQEINELKKVISSTRKFVEPSAFTAKSKKQQHKVSIRKPANRGARKETDRRALQCAIDNAVQVANEKALIAKSENNNVPVSSVDGTAMNELKEMLSLEKDPRRIECYDISHTQGENTVGSRVVFIDGKPVPSLYRTFNIKSVPNGKPDDYKSLEEVLERRFHRVWKKETNSNHNLQLVDENDPWSMPDLVIIDGGKGQLSAALKGMSRANILPYEQNSKNSEETSNVLEVEDDDDDHQYENDDHFIIKEAHYSSSSPSPSSPTSLLGSSLHVARVPIVALAKKREEVFVNNNSNPVNTNSNDAKMLLLRSLRDESHRFALNAMKRRRRKMNGGF